jgi:2-polyprenyl-3-methyl-5-hydroxy-6-metoxy-1,4-benzoquinol methylase
LNDDSFRVLQETSGDIPIYQGQLHNFDLNKEFDVVICLNGSIAHAKTLKMMKRTIRNCKRHLKPGGLMLMEPWMLKEYYHDGIFTFIL